MSTKATHTKDSALAKLTIAFEYDMTWAEAKKVVRDRTI